MSDTTTYEVWIERAHGSWSRVVDRATREELFTDHKVACRAARAFEPDEKVLRTIVVQRTLVADFNCAGKAKALPPEEEEAEPRRASLPRPQSATPSIQAP